MWKWEKVAHPIDFYAANMIQYALNNLSKEGLMEMNCMEDIVPLSSFRASVTRLMSQMKRTHRPIVITQNGRAANIFMDVEDYQNMLDKVEALEKKVKVS